MSFSLSLFPSVSLSVCLSLPLELYNGALVYVNATVPQTSSSPVGSAYEDVELNGARPVITPGAQAAATAQEMTETTTEYATVQKGNRRPPAAAAGAQDDANVYAAVDKNKKKTPAAVAGTSSGGVPKPAVRPKPPKKGKQEKPDKKKKGKKSENTGVLLFSSSLSSIISVCLLTFHAVCISVKVRVRWEESL